MPFDPANTSLLLFFFYHLFSLIVYIYIYIYIHISKDLSFEEKSTVLQLQLTTTPGSFLQQWGQYLRAQHLNHFARVQVYDVQYYVAACRARLDQNWKTTQAKNRRLKHLKVLLEQGAYFADDAMARRRPELYYEYVGQHLSEAEQAARSGAMASKSWANQLLSVVDNQAAAAATAAAFCGGGGGGVTRAVGAGDASPARIEELSDEGEDRGGGGSSAGAASSGGADAFDVAEDNFGGAGGGGAGAGARSGGSGSGGGSDGGSGGGQRPSRASTLPLDERMRLRGEFVRLMREAFLAGEDASFFDYSIIDNDEDLDDLEIRGRDAEESWFDDD